MNKKIIVVVLAVVVAVVAVYLFLGREPSPTPQTSQTPQTSKTPQTPQPSTLNPQPSTPNPQPSQPRENGWAAALGTNRLAAAEAALKRQEPEREMTEAEEKLVEFAKDIAGEQDAKAARRFASEQLNAVHPKVREAAVYALANCGEPCLAELTPFMADADEGVRIEANVAWQSEWFAMPDDALKAESAVAVMCVLNDEAALEPIAAELMKFKRETALEALAVAIEQGTPAGRKVASRITEALGGQ